WSPGPCVVSQGIRRILSALTRKRISRTSSPPLPGPAAPASLTLAKLSRLARMPGVGTPTCSGVGLHRRVGEEWPVVRQWAAEGLGFLGVTIDPARNVGTGDRRIDTGQGTVEVLVVVAREDLQIAHEVR